MGHVHSKVRFEGSAGEREISAPVDTGSTYTMLSPDIADELGIARLPRKFRLRLASGHPVEVEAGTVSVTIVGRTAPITVVILPGAEPLLGVEALGLRVNPATGDLQPTRSYTIRA